MDKRFQVFISSTFADLEEDKKEVMEAIINLDCFPAGMEMFPATDTEQFEYIKSIIDASDYYNNNSEVKDNHVKSNTQVEFLYL